jgi:hypothetical protein
VLPVACLGLGFQLGRRILVAGGPGFVVEQFDSWFEEPDLAGFVETAEGLLEGLFADAELASDDLGRAVVIERQATAVAFECVEDVVGKRGDALIAGGVEAEINFAGWRRVGRDVAVLRARCNREGTGLR